MTSRHDNFIGPIIDYCMAQPDAYPELMRQLASAFLEQSHKREWDLREQCSNTESALFVVMHETQNVKTKKALDAFDFAKSKIGYIVKSSRAFSNWDWLFGQDKKGVDDN